MTSVGAGLPRPLLSSIDGRGNRAPTYMILSIIFILIGSTFLYFGAEWLVIGASRLAMRLGVRRLIIGLTVVSFGTSAPELVSSLFAQLFLGSGNVAVGNVVGSNIYNIGLVLGLSAVLCPMAIHSTLVRREVPINIIVSVLFLLMMWGGVIGRFEGVLLCIAFCAYLGFQFFEARRTREEGALLGEHAKELESGKQKGLMANIGLIVAGSIGLAIGAHLLVTYAVQVGHLWGISDRVIGMTAVAFGTSLPELATSIMAAARKEADLAVGNVVGSNIFNILLIVGSVATIAPLSFDPALLTRDGPFMLLLTVVMMFLLASGRKLHRWEGGLLAAAAMGYTVFLFAV